MATQELSKQEQVEKSARQFISKVYAWMTVALVVSGFAAWYTANSQLLINLIWGTRFGFLVLIIAEIALVWWLSASIGKISASGAKESVSRNISVSRAKRSQLKNVGVPPPT